MESVQSRYAEADQVQTICLLQGSVYLSVRKRAKQLNRGLVFEHVFVYCSYSEQYEGGERHLDGTLMDPASRLVRSGDLIGTYCFELIPFHHRTSGDSF